jgi:hypothetical protein
MQLICWRSKKDLQRTFCIMGQWVYIYGKFKFIECVDNSNARMSEKLFSFKVIYIRPEAEWSNHEQVEWGIEIYAGGLNPYLLKKIGMTCG